MDFDAVHLKCRDFPCKKFLAAFIDHDFKGENLKKYLKYNNTVGINNETFIQRLYENYEIFKEKTLSIEEAFQKRIIYVKFDERNDKIRNLRLEDWDINPFAVIMLFKDRQRGNLNYLRVKNDYFLTCLSKQKPEDSVLR